MVFEGAQGVLLDEHQGFHPYTTWSTTTFANAETLFAEAGAAHAALRLGGSACCARTRHGPGPLPTEDHAFTPALPEPHNGTGRWQGAFRLGHFDAIAHRYALAACGGADAPGPDPHAWTEEIRPAAHADRHGVPRPEARTETTPHPAGCWDYHPHHDH